MFVLIVTSKVNDPTYKGNEFLVVNELGGWITTTSIFWQGVIASNAKIFSSYEEAEEFAKSWNGHPWWCQPYKSKDKYKILEVEPTYRQVITGYKIKE